VSNREEAEDMAGQVFLKALESISSFKWRGVPVSAWLFRIAHNQVIDYWRNAKSKGSRPLDESLVSNDIDPEEVAEMNLDIGRLVQALRQLTKAQREVIELRFAAELSTAEVAKTLGKSQGAVKVLQHNALKTLRRRLSELEQL
jgi:RNA polymerase sigma-70 factor (ECF subfamily)